jgi:hypothetical protein
MFAEFPDSRPVMTVMNTSYREGELLTVNCTTQTSKTSPTLTFYINNRAVSKFTTRDSTVMHRDRFLLFAVTERNE